MNTHRLIWIPAFALLLSYQLANGQAPTLKKCDHESTRMSRFLSDRFQPIVARNYDGSRIEWTFMDDQGSYAGTLNVDKGTKLPMGFPANYKNRLFWAITSTCDDYVYAVYEMAPDQLKEFRKTNPK
jgi:hypothetical protein